MSIHTYRLIASAPNLMQYQRDTDVEFYPVSEPGSRMKAKKVVAAARKLPVGDRRQFLTTMSPDVIKRIKQAALTDDRNAWEIMEEAAIQWLERRDAEDAKNS